MNIMMIIPSLSGGGAERVCATLASALVNKHRIVLITYYHAKNPYIIDPRIIVECLEISNGSNEITKSYNSLKRIKVLRKLKEEYSIDCCISFLYAPNFENVMSRRTEKVIVSLRHKYSVNYKGIKGAINSFTCLYADLSVALSQNVMHDQIINYHTPVNKIITIYNPCDMERIKKLSQETIINKDFWNIRNKFEKIIINAGRLTEQKGQWHLIRAFSEVVKIHPSTALIILGEGKLKSYLSDIITKLELNKNVFIFGFFNNPYPYLSNADIFAFTSLYEGFGNILLEAMACELPIISCDCDAGPRELLAPESDFHQFAKDVELEKYGILTCVMDGRKYTTEPLTKQERDFSDGLKILLEDYNTYKHYKKCSAERIKDFSIDIITKQWESVLPNTFSRNVFL